MEFVDKADAMPGRQILTQAEQAEVRNLTTGLGV
jgi:hypothetical protein